MIWVIILIGVAILAVVIVLAYNKHKKLVESGEIADRNANFVKEAVDFQVKNADPQVVAEKLKAGMQNIGVSCKGSISAQDFEFQGAGWVAALKKIAENDGTSTYRWQFLNWKTRNGMPEDGLNMNRTLTAIEKMFLSIDPETTQTKQIMQVSSRPRFF